MGFLNKGARRIAAVPAAVVLAIGVASCGGGDPFVGLWEGTVNGQSAMAIVLGDGTYYLKYTAAGALGGLVRGTGEFKGADFVSTDGVDYHFAYPPQAPTAAPIKARISFKHAQPAVNGKINNTTPLSLAYVKPFDPDGNIKHLAGTYTGEITFSLGLRTATFDITRDGKLSTLLNGCTITGTVTPRRDDAWDLNILFGPAPCAFPGAAFQGAIIYSHDLQQLDAAVANPAYGQAMTFIARKNPK